MRQTQIRIFAALCSIGAIQMGCSAGSETLGAGENESVGSVEEKLTTVNPGGSHDLQYNFCSSENGTCVTGFAKPVVFGVGTHWAFKIISGNFPCTVAEFGTDPAQGKVKACYISQYGRIAAEGDLATATGSVAYGVAGSYKFQTFSSPTQFACNNQTFGGDPARGFTKNCFAVADYAFSVPENSPMQLYFAPVAFGANGFFNYKVASGNPINCDTTNFGDPIPGVVKACYVLPAGLMASEGQNFTVPGSGGTATAFYGSGANGNFATAQVASGSCTNDFFFGDPDVGTQKFCWGGRF